VTDKLKIKMKLILLQNPNYDYFVNFFTVSERCSRTMLDRLMKQVDHNGKFIASLSERNLDMRKECVQKFNSDFDLYYEKFHYRPKSEILALRGKSFEVGITQRA